jgi:ferredoxin
MASDMVEVVFEPGQTRIWVQPGSTILAAGEAAGIEIIHGCTEGMCGTDPVQILNEDGMLSDPEDHESGTLERMGLTVGFRLSCSARILRGPVHVRTDAF